MAVWEDGGARGPFSRLPRVHFARLLLLEDIQDLDGRLIPASLVLESEVDSPLGGHVDDLVEREGATLDAAFGLCEGYPDAPGPAERRAYLLAHRLRPQARYVNAVGRTLEQTQRGEQLGGGTGGFPAAHRAAPRAAARGTRAAVRGFARDEPSLGGARGRAPAPPLAHRLRE